MIYLIKRMTENQSNNYNKLNLLSNVITNDLKTKADEGESYSQYIYGLYLIDNGYIDDSIVYLYSAANNGNIKAQCKYASVILKYKNDFNEAIIYYNKAALKRYIPAQLILASFYYSGKYCNVDYTLVYKYAIHPAKLGNPRGQIMIAMCYLDKNNNKQMIKWLLASAKNNYPPAQKILGYFYYIGKGVKKNDKLAFEWIEKAAKQGSHEAISKYAIFYYNGIYVNKNIEYALKLFLKTDNKEIISIIAIECANLYFDNDEEKFTEYINIAIKNNNKIARNYNNILEIHGKIEANKYYQININKPYEIPLKLDFHISNL